MSDFSNRLEKNARHRQKWAKRHDLTAFRVYDLDIPAWPYAIDVYGDFIHIMEFPRSRQSRDTVDTLRTQVIDAVTRILQVPPSRIFTKTHEPKAWGHEQYERQSHASTIVTVRENDLYFECNLSDFLDTGLFLDHRNTRARVKREAKDKRFLNLFAYTGAFSVHAIAGGATSSTTVDLSKQYCDWAARNFTRNQFATSAQHQIVCADVLSWLESAATKTPATFDLIVIDPPSFSTSKKMERRFDVQKDHRRLLEMSYELMAPGGAIYFSTNFLQFKLDESLRPAEELTPKSIPDDFRRTVHRCWKFIGKSP